jgi:hypothetical protein
LHESVLEYKYKHMHKHILEYEHKRQHMHRRRHGQRRANLVSLSGFGPNKCAEPVRAIVLPLAVVLVAVNERLPPTTTFLQTNETKEKKKETNISTRRLEAVPDLILPPFAVVAVPVLPYVPCRVKITERE